MKSFLPSSYKITKTHEITVGDIKQYYHLAPAMYSALETHEGNQIYQDVKYLLKLTGPIRLRLNIYVLLSMYGLM